MARVVLLLVNMKLSDKDLTESLHLFKEYIARKLTVTVIIFISVHNGQQLVPFTAAKTSSFHSHAHC